MSADTLDTMIIHAINDLTLFAQLSYSQNLTEYSQTAGVNSLPLHVFNEPVYQTNAEGELIASSARITSYNVCYTKLLRSHYLRSFSSQISFYHLVGYLEHMFVVSQCGIAYN